MTYAASSLEEENAYLKKELQMLYGKLGAQGNKQNSEKKYRDLQAQLYEAYNQIEAIEKQKRDLRDDFAKAAMQGMISTHLSDPDYPKRGITAKIAYEFADAMIKERDKK